MIVLMGYSGYLCEFPIGTSLPISSSICGVLTMTCATSMYWTAIGAVALSWCLMSEVKASEDSWTPQSIEKIESENKIGPSCRIEIAAKGKFGRDQD